MAKSTRGELENLCQRLLADGQQVTTRIEQLLQRAEPLQDGQFDRELERLRRSSEEIHRQLEKAFDDLRALDENP